MPSLSRLQLCDTTFNSDVNMLTVIICCIRFNIWYTCVQMQFGRDGKVTGSVQRLTGKVALQFQVRC